VVEEGRNKELDDVVEQQEISERVAAANLTQQRISEEEQELSFIKYLEETYARNMSMPTN